MNRRMVIFSAACIGLNTRGSAAKAMSSPGKIWHVRQESDSAGDGTSWSTAFVLLQDALAAAASGDEIWVARGNYVPHTEDATKSFVLKQGVAIYGGFEGIETARGQRDFVRNATILSGNIGKGDRTKNTHTIVMGADDAVLDGFTITDAYGTDEPRLHIVPADIMKGDMVVGGGMRNFMTSPLVQNCIFKNNHSPKGGGVYNVHKPEGDQATFIDVDFIENSATIRGGAVSNDLGAMPRFINCRFIGNRCEDKGGGLYNDFSASPMMFNAVFTNNEAKTAGGVGNDGGACPLLVNVTIQQNRATDGLGPDLYQGTGANNNPILVNSIVGEIYNWHENIVSEVGSTVPAGQTLPLVEFLPISNLNNQIEPAALASIQNHIVGYDPHLDGSTLLTAGAVATLVEFYVKNKGVVEYEDEYTRPTVDRQPVRANVIYVVPLSTQGSQDGLSWDTALDDLQAAIDLASISNAAVWVKAGSYRPSERRDRIAAFILYDNVKVYGGFSGTETALTRRPPDGPQTVLSGKVATDAYRYPHVLYGANNVVLDGLTICEGNAVGFTYNGKGGGLLAYHAGKTFLPHGRAAYQAGRSLVDYSELVGFKMTIQNCRFERNNALEGGAIYAFGKADLTISNTTFKENRAVYGGAVVDREGVVSTYLKSSFIRNLATQDGGAVYADYGSQVTFEETEFNENQAQRDGGAIYLISRASQLGATAVTVKKSGFTGNTAVRGSSAFNLDGSTLSIENSTYPADSVYSP